MSLSYHSGLDPKSRFYYSPIPSLRRNGFYDCGNPAVGEKGMGVSIIMITTRVATPQYGSQCQKTAVKRREPETSSG